VKVSVLLKAYNHEPFIARALASVLEQRTDFPFEIVIGEDCSTDGTRAVLLGMRDRDPRIRLLLRDRNLGNIRNLTDTLAACRGEYVALLDGDDYWTSADKLQTQAAFLDAHPHYSSCAHNAVVVDATAQSVLGTYRPPHPSHAITLRRMLIGDRSLGDIVSGPGRTEGLGAPVGLPLADMTGDQRGGAVKLVEEYARNMRGELAEEELRHLHEAGLGRVFFAWAGPLTPGQAHYYRLHGPTLLIEYDNTQNDANHIHSVWRDPRNDFGADLLRAHYQSSHHRPA